VSTQTFGYRSREVPLPRPTLSPDVVVSRPRVQKELPRRRMFHALDPKLVATGKAPVHVDTNDIDTQVDGIAQRMGRIVPEGNRNRIQKLAHYVDKWCLKYLKPLTQQPSFNDWIETNTSYTQARKDELIKCFEELNGGPPNRKQRRKINSFIKAESYPQYKHARWINSRSDHFKAWAGPWFKAIEEQVYSLKWFIKHTPVPERPMKVSSLMRDLARYFASDHTAFEAHMTPLIMQTIECRVYRFMLQNFPEVAEIIAATIAGVNHGRTRRGVTFRLKGRRMSGDMCTSLGNGLTNLILWAFLCEENGAEWDGFVEGDDGIFAVYKGTAPTTEDYKSLGFTIKLEEGSDPRTMSFCGIIAADGQNIKDPIDFAANFGWSSSCVGAGEKVRHELLRAKALSAVYELPHCPVIRAIADLALDITQNSAPRFISDGYHEIPRDTANVPAFSPTETTRIMFSKLFGMSSECQQYLEETIRTSQSLDCLNVFSAHADMETFAFSNVLTG